MRIGFEAKRLFTNYTGLGNYSRFIVSALSAHKPQNEYLLFTPREVSNDEVQPIVSQNNVNVVTPSGLFRTFSRVWRTWGLSKTSPARDLDLFHGLSQELPFGLPRKVKTVVTVHDLIFLRFPEFYHPWDVSIYKTKVKSACSRADRIVAISHQTARDIIDFLRVDPSKIDVVYQGCHPSFKRRANEQEKRNVREKYRLPKKFILNVGTIEKRKNIGLLVEALERLPKDEQIPLVIIGRPSVYMQEISELVIRKKLKDRIIFLHNAAFQDFPAIYQQAQVFVYPSLFEGFGIPLVEAIESNVPVITSEGSCFLEAAGPGALYVDSRDPDDLATKLSNVLRDESLRGRMREQSSHHIRQFQPENIADDLEKVYDALF